jgi:hypothetical protein
MDLPKAIPSEFYGDNPRFFTGLVIDARPPEGEGLEGYVRVRIHGVHSPSLKDVPESALPWAQVLIPTTEGGTSGLGSTPRIEAGTLVFGFFMDGKYSQVPIVLGSLPHITTPTPIQLGFDPIQPDDTVSSGFSINLDAVSNEDTGNITSKTQSKRIEETLKAFLDEGFDPDTAMAITAKLDIASNMVTGEHPDGSFGLDNFTGERLDQLKNFSPDYQNFDTQVQFLRHELNSTRADVKANLGNTLTSKVKALGASDTNAVKNKVYELNDKYGGG